MQVLFQWKGIKLKVQIKKQFHFLILYYYTSAAPIKLIPKLRFNNMVASNSNSVFFYITNQIPVFHGEHYEYWNSHMETIFLLKDLWDGVEEGYEESPHQKIADSTNGKEREYKRTWRKMVHCWGLSNKERAKTFILESLA